MKYTSRIRSFAIAKFSRINPKKRCGFKHLKRYLHISEIKKETAQPKTKIRPVVRDFCALAIDKFHVFFWPDGFDWRKPPHANRMLSTIVWSVSPFYDTFNRILEHVDHFRSCLTKCFNVFGVKFQIYLIAIWALEPNQTSQSKWSNKNLTNSSRSSCNLCGVNLMCLFLNWASHPYYRCFWIDENGFRLRLLTFALYLVRWERRLNVTTFYWQLWELNSSY